MQAVLQAEALESVKKTVCSQTAWAAGTFLLSAPDQCGSFHRVLPPANAAAEGNSGVDICGKPSEKNSSGQEKSCPELFFCAFCRVQYRKRNLVSGGSAQFQIPLPSSCRMKFGTFSARVSPERFQDF